MSSSPEHNGDFDDSPPPPPPPYASSSFYFGDHDEEDKEPDQEEYASSSYYFGDHDEEDKEPDQEEYASSSFYFGDHDDEDKEPDPEEYASSSFYYGDHDDEDKEPDQEEEEEEKDEQNYLGIFLDDLLVELFDEEPEKQQNCNFGYKFCPTDYDLIVHYLIRKILNQPLPCNRVVDAELLYHYNPERIAEENNNYGETAWYFFTRRTQQYRKGKCPILVAGDGYWKAKGADKEIKSKEIVVGYRKKFVFYRGNPLSGDKTNWIMQEYRITHPPITERIKNGKRVDKWILCKLYKINEEISRKTRTQKACSKSHANDRTESMTNVDPKTEKVDIVQNECQKLSDDHKPCE